MSHGVGIDTYIISNKHNYNFTYIFNCMVYIKVNSNVKLIIHATYAYYVHCALNTNSSLLRYITVIPKCGYTIMYTQTTDCVNSPLRVTAAVGGSSAATVLASLPQMYIPS